MFEHPYLAYTITEHDQQQLQRDVERRRMLKENADRVIPRAVGPVRRAWERMLRGDARPLPAADRGAAVVAADRRVPVCCEPAAAR